MQILKPEGAFTSFNLTVQSAVCQGLWRELCRIFELHGKQSHCNLPPMNLDLAKKQMNLRLSAKGLSRKFSEAGGENTSVLKVTMISALGCKCLAPPSQISWQPLKAKIYDWCVISFKTVSISGSDWWKYFKSWKRNWIRKKKPLLGCDPRHPIM